MKKNEDKHQFYRYIRQLISEDKIETALEQLESAASKKKNLNFIILQKARLAAANYQNHQNLISLSDLSQQKAQIQLAILEFLDETDKKNLFVINITGQKIINIILLLTFFLVILFLFLSPIGNNHRAAGNIATEKKSNSLQSPLYLHEPTTIVEEPRIESDGNYEHSMTKSEFSKNTIIAQLEKKKEIDEEKEMVRGTIRLKSNSIDNLEGYKVYFRDVNLRQDLDTTNTKGEVYYSFTKEDKMKSSRIIVEFDGKTVPTINKYYPIGDGFIGVEVKN